MPNCKLFILFECRPINRRKDHRKEVMQVQVLYKYLQLTFFWNGTALNNWKGDLQEPAIWTLNWWDTQFFDCFFAVFACSIDSLYTLRHEFYGRHDKASTGNWTSWLPIDSHSPPNPINRNAQRHFVLCKTQSKRGNVKVALSSWNIKLTLNMSKLNLKLKNNIYFKLNTWRLEFL